MDHCTAWILTGLLTATVVVYAPLRTAPFVYEDAAYRGAPVRWQVPGRPLTITSLHLTGDRAGDAHLVQLAIHLLNGALVATVGLTLAGPTVGLLAAGLFLLHPLNSEAVSYLAARGDVLVTTATLAATGLLLRWTAVGGVLTLLTATLAIGAAGASKEVGLMAVPLVVLTLLVWRRDRPPTQFFFNALLGATGLVVGVLWGDLANWLAMTPGEGGSPWTWSEHAGVQAAHLWRLATLLVWPVGFTIDHDPVGYGIASRIGALGLTAGVLSAGVLAWRRVPMAAWAIGWVAVTLAPRFVFATSELTHEYHLYPAMAGLSIGAGAAVAALIGASHRPERMTDGPE